MSTVHAVIIKDKKIQYATKHYRKIMEMLNTSKLTPRKMLDAGYILIDLDKKILLNCQNAFSLHDLDEKEWLGILSKWRLLDYAKW